MSTNQQDNYNVLFDSLNYYRQLADQLQDILNSTNTQNHEVPFANYNNIEFTDNTNDNSVINSENDLQDSTFENVLNEEPLNINNDEILYNENVLKESTFSFNNTEFLDQTENNFPEQYMCYGYMTCNGDDMYLLGPISDEDEAEWYTTSEMIEKDIYF